jgi:hypothetical protein
VGRKNVGACDKRMPKYRRENHEFFKIQDGAAKKLRNGAGCFMEIPRVYPVGQGVKSSRLRGILGSVKPDSSQKALH